MLFNLAHPGLDGRETLAVCDVVGHNNAVGALVVAGSNCLEALLTCSVPDLKLDSLAINVDRPDLEVYTDCGHEILGEHIVL